MKFRLQCASCNIAFFSTDRKARYCAKCVKKRTLKPQPRLIQKSAPQKVSAPRIVHRPAFAASAAPKPDRKLDERKPERKPPKIKELTPELRQRIEHLYREQFVGTELSWREMVAKISDLIWLNRKAVSIVLRDLIYPKIEITPEMKKRIIEMYQVYVERGERPAGGRRRTISQVLGVPYGQTKDIVFEWSQAQYGQSPTPELTREQKFEIEKVYWDELNRGQHDLNELPASVAERLGYTTAYQIARWLDRLHDDDTKFERVQDVAPEIEQRIHDAYHQYLSAPAPPEQGLHATIAHQVGGVTTRQVHKVLQRYRKQRRSKYPVQ